MAYFGAILFPSISISVLKASVHETKTGMTYRLDKTP